MARPHPWHRGSVFGDGLRRPLTRDEQGIWRHKMENWFRAGELTALHCRVGEALLRRVRRSGDGRLDPSHETIAADVGCSVSTVERALRRMNGLGLVSWQRRLVRVEGWRTEQTSNAYRLHPDGRAPAVSPVVRRAACDRQPDRESLNDCFYIEATPETSAAQAALRARNEARQAEQLAARQRARLSPQGRGTFPGGRPNGVRVVRLNF